MPIFLSNAVQQSVAVFVISFRYKKNTHPRQKLALESLFGTCSWFSLKSYVNVSYFRVGVCGFVVLLSQSGLSGPVSKL